MRGHNDLAHAAACRVRGDAMNELAGAGGEHHALAAGETLLMPANVPHAINPIEPFKMLLVMLRTPADAPK